MIASAKPKILLLDDDSSFLDVAAYFLEKKFGNSVTISKFNTSNEFLEHIESTCYLPESPQNIIRAFYSGEINQENIEQSLKDLSMLPAILIVDHHLRNESTNGVEISEKIRDYIPCPYIILLTAQIDEKNAVKLHNKAVIDLFVRKDDVTSLDYIYSELKNQISNLNDDCAINPEDAFESDTILDDDLYISKREELLKNLEYKSYLTISSSGEIAVLDHNDQISIYHYNRGFSLNG